MDLAYLEQERNGWYRIASALLYLALVSVIAHLFQKNLIAFVLAPGAFLFNRPTKSYFVFLVLGCNILFFEFYLFRSDFGPFGIQDSVIMAFLFLRFLKTRELLSFKIPVSTLLVFVYLFIIHGLIMSLVSLTTMGVDAYAVMDTRCVLYLLLILFLWGDELFSPKALTSLLISIVFFASVFSVISIVVFIATAERVVSWSEIFFSDGFIIALVLLPLIHEPRIKRCLFVAAALCFMALLTAQTRSIWISTTMSSLLYCCIFLIKNKTIRIMKMVRMISVVFLVFLFTHVLLLCTVNLDLPTYVSSRLFHRTNDEYSNAGTSMGYRIYESYMVWRNKTLVGHGSGARIHLLFTQTFPPKFINWWCIHSGYFDLLHKYGFIGLGLYIGILVLILKRAVSLMRAQKRITRTFGTIVFLTLLNHCVISITSQYFFKENVMMYIVVLIGIVERYRQHRPHDDVKNMDSGALRRVS
jgi:hypothetical protein